MTSAAADGLKTLGDLDYGMLIVISPGEVIEITPNQVQLQMEILSSAGMPPISTSTAPATHGVTVAGMHGIGVNTPKAAAVAEATTGLAMEVHIPNGTIFVIGM